MVFGIDLSWIRTAVVFQPGLLHNVVIHRLHQSSTSLPGPGQISGYTKTFSSPLTNTICFVFEKLENKDDTFQISVCFRHCGLVEEGNTRITVHIILLLSLFLLLLILILLLLPRFLLPLFLATPLLFLLLLPLLLILLLLFLLFLLLFLLILLQFLLLMLMFLLLLFLLLSF